MILLLLVAPVGCSRVKTKSGVIPATTQSASAPARFGILTRRAAVGPFVGEVCALTFTRDGKTLIASSHFGAFYAYGDLTFLTPDPLAVLACVETDPGYVQAQLMPDGRLLTLTRVPTHITQVSLDIWDVESRKKVETITHSGRLWGKMSISPDGKTVAMHDRSGGQVFLYDMEGRSTKVLAVSEQVNSVDFAPKGSLLAAAGDAQIHLVDTTTWQEKVALKQHSLCVRFSHDGKLLFAGGPGGNVIWDVQKRQPRVSIPIGEEAYPCCVAFSPDDRVVAIGSAGLVVWDARTGSELARMSRKDLVPHSLVFSADGKTLFTGTGDQWDTPGQGQIVIWDVSKPE